MWQARSLTTHSGETTQEVRYPSIVRSKNVCVTCVSSKGALLPCFRGNGTPPIRGPGTFVWLKNACGGVSGALPSAQETTLALRSTFINTGKEPSPDFNRRFALTRSPSSALLPFSGGGFPYSNRLQRKKGSLFRTSLLPDLVKVKVSLLSVHRSMV